MITEEKRLENGWRFTFKVSAKDGSVTRHTVTLDGSYWEKLTHKVFAPQTLAEKSFEFLLEREPKESILAEFNLSDIPKYFPEYEAVIQERLS